MTSASVNWDAQDSPFNQAEASSVYKSPKGKCKEEEEEADIEDENESISSSSSLNYSDNEDNKKAVKENLHKLGEKALQTGELAVIGHVRENTVQALEAVIPQLEEKGIKLVYASQLVE